MRWRPSAAVAVCAAMALRPALAMADDAQVLARAVGALPNAKVVAFVAARATPTMLDAHRDADVSALTPEAVAARLCGVVEDGYLDQLDALNSGLVIPRGQPL